MNQASISSRFFRFQTARSIFALILREMATTYGRSPGGYFWAVAEPAAGVALLTIVFSLGFRSPPIGTDFAIFYATGLIPFFAFRNLSTKTAKAINYSKRLLFYPKVTYVDAIIARFVLNSLTQMLVAIIVFGFIFIALGTRTIIDFQAIWLGFLMVFALSFGIGVFNCFMFSKFPVWESFWNIVTRPLFIASCIFFLFDTIPEPFRGILWYNPLIHIVGIMRRGFYPTYAAEYVTMSYVFAVSIIACFFGFLLLYKFSKDILNS